MLTTIKGLTEGVAKGIVREYPTLRCLYEAYRRCSNEKEKQLMLVGIAVRRSLSRDAKETDEGLGEQKGNNRNGAATDRTIGASISTTVYNIFNGRAFLLRLSLRPHAEGCFLRRRPRHLSLIRLHPSTSDLAARACQELHAFYSRNLTPARATLPLPPLLRLLPPCLPPPPSTRGAWDPSSTRGLVVQRGPPCWGS